MIKIMYLIFSKKNYSINDLSVTLNNNYGWESAFSKG